MPAYSVRITLPFSDVSGAVRAWALKADSLLCYEHVGAMTEKTHVHLLLMGCSQTTERLKQIARTTGVDGKGNEFWSFKTKSKRHGPITADTAPKYITYMSKGTIQPSYIKGYELDYLEQLRGQWVDSPPSQDEELYQLFEKSLDGFSPFIHVAKLLEVVKNDPKLIDKATVPHVMQAKARSWSFIFHKNIWSARTACVAKMVFLTYCMRNGVVVPDQFF